MELDYKIIDCDVHNQIKGPHSLLPYLKEPWRSRVEKFLPRFRIHRIKWILKRATAYLSLYYFYQWLKIAERG
jgi:hypothetical protein